MKLFVKCHVNFTLRFVDVDYKKKQAYLNFTDRTTFPNFYKSMGNLIFSSPGDVVSI